MFSLHRYKINKISELLTMEKDFKNGVFNTTLKTY